MAEFFCRMRCGVGYAALVVACLFAVGWARSYWVEDSLTIPSDGYYVCLESASGFITVYESSGDCVADGTVYYGAKVLDANSSPIARGIPHGLIVVLCGVSSACLIRLRLSP